MASTEKDRDDKKDIRRSRYQTKVYFDHQGREISLVFSFFSGLEQVYVDNQLVSQCRNWHFKNVHVFNAGGVSYSLQVTVKKNLKSLLSGVVTIQLRANGAVIDSDQFHALQHMLGKGNSAEPLTRTRLLLSLLPYIAGGLIVGFAVGYFGSKYFF